SVQQNRALENGVQLAGYESAVEQNPRVTSIAPAAAAESTAERRMTTTSIPLPQNYRLPTGSPGTHSAVPANVVSENAVQRMATPQMPIQTAAPAAMQPVQPQAFQSTRAGAFPPQALIKPTVSTPTVHLPTSQGFGFAAIDNEQSLAPQRALPQVAPRTYPGMVSWSSAQTAGQMTTPQTGQLQLPQQGTIVQPASQPLPPPTPLTTTVSSPPVPFLQ
ncbi:MAG TPA: hypothetical protein VJ828_18010, partial [Lacipirellulaceae bacterium]|nr:hypothetical protein [Lacipirellulaceae bacterium]